MIGRLWQGTTGTVAVLLFGLVIAPLLVAQEARAGRFEDGYAAYQRGDFAMARNIWTALAEEGEPRAQYNLGIIYDEGRGVRASRDQARQWWRKAAAQNVPEALHNLATSYLFGVDAKDDHKEGLAFLANAAKMGLSRSQYVLGKIYLHGRGVSRALRCTEWCLAPNWERS